MNKMKKTKRSKKATVVASLMVGWLRTSLWLWSSLSGRHSAKGVKSFGKVNIMSRNIKSIAAAATFMFSLSLISSAWAYIDPNTTHTVFNALGMSLVAAGVIFNILFWPILFLRKRIKARFRKLSRFWKAVVLCGTGLLLTAVVIFLYRLIF